MSKQAAPKSPVLLNCIKAFLVGGLICTIGQVEVNLLVNAGMEIKDARLLCSVSLVLLSIILTGFNVYDNIAKHAGAGTLVPITGFANAVVSPAIDFKSEGFITGMAAKMFLVAGPVIVFGTIASVLYGIAIMLFDLA